MKRIIGSVCFAVEGYNVKYHSSAAVCHHATLIVCCAECMSFSFGGSERINFRLIKVFGI